MGFAALVCRLSGTLGLLRRQLGSAAPKKLNSPPRMVSATLAIPPKIPLAARSGLLKPDAADPASSGSGTTFGRVVVGAGAFSEAAGDVGIPSSAGCGPSPSRSGFGVEGVASSLAMAAAVSCSVHAASAASRSKIGADGSVMRLAALVNTRRKPTGCGAWLCVFSISAVRSCCRPRCLFDARQLRRSRSASRSRVCGQGLAGELLVKRVLPARLIDHHEAIAPVAVRQHQARRRAPP